MADGILAEFFLKLGWKTDDAGTARIFSILRNTQVQAQLAADAIEKVIGKIREFSEGIATAYEDLYYASQRNRTSVENIKAFGYAAGNMGSSVEAARSSIERFGLNLRSNSGFYGVIQGMGVRTKEANGQFRDTVSIMTDLGKVLARKPEQQRLQYADMLGIDEQTMRAIISPEFEVGIEKYRKLIEAGHFDPQGAAEAWKDFNNTFRDFMTTMDLLVDKVMTRLVKEFGPSFRSFVDYLIQNSDAISSKILGVIDAVINMAKEGVKWIGNTSEFQNTWKIMKEDIVKVGDAIVFLVHGIEKLINFLYKLNQYADNAAKALNWLTGQKGPNGETYYYAGSPNPGAGDAGVSGGSGGSQGSAGPGGSGSSSAPAEKPPETPASTPASPSTTQTAPATAPPTGSSPAPVLTSEQLKAHADAEPSTAGPRVPDSRPDASPDASPDAPSPSAPGAQSPFGGLSPVKPDAKAKPWWGTIDQKPGPHEDANEPVKKPSPIAAVPNADAGAQDPEKDIAGDLSGLATYPRKNEKLPSLEGFIVHHTGGRGTPASVINTLNARGLGVQFVMDRDGKIFRALPNGSRAAHILPSEINNLSNNNTEGMEVIAKDDSDVTKAQIAAGVKFLRDLKAQHPNLQVFGHGEVNPHHKMASEGKTITDAFRASGDVPQITKTPDNAIVPLHQRTIFNFAHGSIDPQTPGMKPGDANHPGLASAPLTTPSPTGGNTNVSINQKTSIAVDGSYDAHELQKATALSQLRTNGDLLRTMQGAAQ